MKKLESIFKVIYYNIKLDFKEIIKKIKAIKNNEIINKKSYIGIVILSFTIIFFGIIYSNINKSKEVVIEGFKNSLINGQSSKLCKYVRVNNKKVSSKELEPLIKYYAGKQQSIKNIETSLKGEGNSGNFVLQNEKGILKDIYYVSINTVKIEFISNIPNIDIEFDNNKFKLPQKEEFDVIPGSYNVIYKYDTKYGEIKEEICYDLIENKTVDIKVNGNYITLYSNFDDSKVFINNIDTNLLAKDIKNYGPIPKGKNINLYLEKEFPWGNIKSETINIDEYEYVKLDINMVNDKLITIVNEVINEFYSSSFKALNDKNKDIIVNSTTEVKDIIYDYINEKTLLFGNNYEITDFQIEIEKSDFKYENNTYKASLLTKVDYNVNKKILPFIKNANESYFILNLQYINDNFIIDGIQKVNV